MLAWKNPFLFDSSQTKMRQGLFLDSLRPFKLTYVVIDSQLVMNRATPTTGAGVLLKNNGTYSKTVDAGTTLSLIEINKSNTDVTSTGHSEFVGIKVTTADSCIDCGVGVQIKNFGRADAIHIQNAGLPGAAANNRPSGIGLDLNRSAGGSTETSPTMTGFGAQIWDWSQTNQGTGGPISLLLRKHLNANSDHILAYLHANRRAQMYWMPGGAGWDATQTLVSAETTGTTLWKMRADGNHFWANGLGSYYTMTSGNEGSVHSSGTNLHIIGGSGGLNIRNNANTLNSVFINDAGVLTMSRNNIVFQNNVTGTFFTGTSGNQGYIIGSAANVLGIRALLGGTSFRNNADNADNFTLTDNGDGMFRGSLIVGAAVRDSLLTDSLGAHIKRGLLVDSLAEFGVGVLLDSIVASTQRTAPPQAKARIYTQGVGKVLVDYVQNGVVTTHNLDSTGASDVPNSRTLTINGNAPASVSGGTQDLSANRTWTVSVDTTTNGTGLTTLNQNGLKANKSTTMTIAANAPLSSSAGAQDLSANRTWTLSADTSTNGTGLATLYQAGLKVPKTTTISTTSPLTGGGDLSANRTFAITAANLVGTSNQVNLSASGTGVLLGSGNITLSTPQNIHTAATPQFLRLGLGTSADATANIWSLQTGLGVTSTDGLVLTNTTAAGAGAQQISPRIHLIGQGWKTNSVAASQSTDWIIENLPVQGAANPTANLNISSSINGGSYTNRFQLASGGDLTLTGKVTGITQATATTDAVAGGRTISTTAPITGGGDLTADRTIAVTASNLLGTTNQVSVASGTGVVLGSSNVTLSTPQDIATASTPQFARMGLGVAADANYLLYLAKTSALSDNIFRTNSGATPAYSQYKMTANGLGSLAMLEYSADNASIEFDVDWAAAGLVARHAAVARISKQSSQLQIQGSTGNTIGNAASPANLFVWDLGTGNVSTAKGVFTQYNSVATEGYGLPAIVDTVERGGQATTISATNLNGTTIAGTYEVSYYGSCTTASGTSTFSIVIDWDNNTKTFTSASCSNAATANYIQGDVIVRNVPVSASSIRYSTTTSGTIGSARWQVIIVVKRLY